MSRTYEEIFEDMFKITDYSSPEVDTLLAELEDGGYHYQRLYDGDVAVGIVGYDPNPEPVLDIPD